MKYFWKVIGNKATIVDASGKPVSQKVQSKVLADADYDFGKIEKFAEKGSTKPASGKSYVNRSGNIVTPKDAKQEQEFIALDFKVSTGDPGEGDKIDDGKKGKIPKWLADNEQFKSLSADEQEYMTNYYNVLTTQDEENQKIFAQALTDAEADANPFFAEKIRMAKDELSLALGTQTSDFTSQKTQIETRIERIKEDLATGKDRLSIDEQAELARQQRTFEVQLDTLVEGAASRGLTFSTKRALAEKRLKEGQTDIVESTKRQFQRKISDLQVAATRGDQDAQNLLADYERTFGENVTSLVRGTETRIGTSNLPDISGLPGDPALGGVTGTLAEEKQADILQRAEALANLRSPF